GDYGYMEEAGLQILEMTYRGSELSMVLLLPREPNGLPALEAQVSEKLAGWLKLLGKSKVDVSIPRFKVESRFEPDRQLKALGMPAAFDPKVSDFSGMSDLASKDPLFISKVIHQAFVDVNEEGTEAA